MATTKTQRITDAITTLAARSRIYGDTRATVWAHRWAADAGEHCGHVAAYYGRTLGLWGRSADEAEAALVALVVPQKRTA